MLRSFSPLIDLCRANVETHATSIAEIPIDRNIASPNPQLLWWIQGSPDDDPFVFSYFLAFLLKTWINGQVIPSNLILLGVKNCMNANGVYVLP